jgi:peptidoglycan/LPS O-acetylase OafA/YrhL
VFSSSLLTRSAQERFYHPEFDLLRCFAFVLIFFHHSLPHDPAFYGNMHISFTLARVLAAIGFVGCLGVQLFFLLSAYLVTELLIRERALRGDIDLKAFYSRRFLRIWPLYYGFLALAWAMQWFVPGQHIGWRAALAFAFFAGNWWTVFVGFPSSVIFHLWFISAQEQFYFFWPAIMRKLSGRGIILAAVAMLATANLTRWYLAAHYTWESRIWCNTFAQLDSIALGILVAVLLAGRVLRLTSLQRAALFFGGLVCFFLATSYFRIKADPLTTTRVVLGYPSAVLGSLFLFLAALRPSPGKSEGAPYLPQSADVGGTPPSRSWQWLLSPLAYLGRISFGLYVFHILGLLISDHLVAHQDSSLGRYFFREAVAFALAVVFATISYFCLEKPFLGLKQRFRRVPSR